jgi:hypothetical protein
VRVVALRYKLPESLHTPLIPFPPVLNWPYL